jgi:ZIP family zinc transporter
MNVFAFTLIPVAAMTVGAAATTLRRPGPKLTSAIQHFAAGVVFAAAAGEILPDLKHDGAQVPVLIGGLIAVALMLLVKHLGEKAKGNTGFVAVVATDILIDGLVLGIGFAAGARQGLMLTLALTLEVLFLGVTVAISLGSGGLPRGRVIAATLAIGLLLPLGALAGGPISTLSPAVVTGFFAFGLIALLYLVTEELLVEAHETEETPLITAMFFLGFLTLLLIEEAL